MLDFTTGLCIDNCESQDDYSDQLKLTIMSILTEIRKFRDGSLHKMIYLTDDMIDTVNGLDLERVKVALRNDDDNVTHVLIG